MAIPIEGMQFPRKWMLCELPSRLQTPGYQFKECHMIFEIKLNGYQCKAQLVTGGHMADAQAILMYASFISREMVQLLSLWLL